MRLTDDTGPPVFGLVWAALAESGIVVGERSFEDLMRFGRDESVMFSLLLRLFSARSWAITYFPRIEGIGLEGVLVTIPKKSRRLNGVC